MQIDAAEYADGKLILTTRDREAARFVLLFQPGRYEIRQARKKRSLDSNAYMWALVDQIAEKTGVPKTEVYRRAVREIGGVSYIVCCLEEVADRICADWSSNGIGWFGERFPSKLEGCVNLTLYYGSSAYDQQQMSRLIDYVIEDARALGIETMPRHKLDAMLEAWGKHDK